MSTTQEQAATLTLRVSLAMKKQLADLAQATGRAQASLALDALRRYLEVEMWEISKIQQGLRDAEAGRFATPEQMEALRNRFQASRDERAL